MVVLERGGYGKYEDICLAWLKAGGQVACLHRRFDQDIEIGFDYVDLALVDGVDDMLSRINSVHPITLCAQQGCRGQSNISQTDNTDDFVKTWQTVLL